MVKNQDKEMVEWKENSDPLEWDAMVVSLQGHPLQSAQWGNARERTEGIKEYRWVAYQHGAPVFIARFEERRILKWIKIAWVPKGPIFFQEHKKSLQDAFIRRLKAKNFHFCVLNPWGKVENHQLSDSYFYTIWVNLKLGKDKLWQQLSKQFRYDVRKATRDGVTIEKTVSTPDVKMFYDQCRAVSHMKKFHLNTSFEFMSELLQANNDHVESFLFVARYQGKLCGGAFVIRCGTNIHYMWGAIDRTFSKLTIGEALQWHIIEWALSQGCYKYDLEGVNPKLNTGVNHFKRKLSGELIACCGTEIKPLSTLFRLFSFIFEVEWILRILKKLVHYAKG